MASHLASIATKENIEAEPAALELISIKADGGLRDALSMFDLNVTFSTDNTLRHKDVLENLHILDSDYYLQITDHMAAQNHVGALVLLDEIMRKGFDGQQFISGFMEHLRNLLFAKDPQTLALMEISDESRTKFKLQAEKTNTSFLLSAMNICSQCEINYKAAKNPRLHLELCLLKINYLPSVFQPATEGGGGKKSEPQAKVDGAKITEKAPETDKIPILEPMPQVVAEELVDQAPVEIPMPTPIREPKVNTGSGLRSAKKVVDTKGSESDAADLSATGNNNTSASKIFSHEELTSVWENIASEFKDANLINNFVMMNRPIKLIDSIIHIKVENEVQVQQFNENIRLEVLGKIRERLQNFSIDIALDVIEMEKSDKKMLYTQSDKYDFLAQKHPLLSEMKQKLGLDYEY
jgi:DNA polymerase-3 subunit gamma/tau